MYIELTGTLSDLTTVKTENPTLARTLPIATRTRAVANRPRTEAPTITKAPVSAKPRILVVDDEKSIADSLVFLLKHEGFDALAVYSGEEAQQAAAAAPVDLLISDVMMSGVNGVDAAIKIRQHSPSCRVILFSGHASAPPLVEQANADGYDFELIQKPLHPQELLTKLRIALAR